MCCPPSFGVFCHLFTAFKVEIKFACVVQTLFIVSNPVWVMARKMLNSAKLPLSSWHCGSRPPTKALSFKSSFWETRNATVLQRWTDLSSPHSFSHLPIQSVLFSLYSSSPNFAHNFLKHTYFLKLFNILFSRGSHSVLGTAICYIHRV